MRNLFCFCILFISCKIAASQMINHQNEIAKWGEDLVLRCRANVGEIYITSAKFGYLGEGGGPSCFTKIGSYVRKICNKKHSCRVPVVKGPQYDETKTTCHTVPKLYVEFMCINRGSSITDMSTLGTLRKLATFLEPTFGRTGYTSQKTTWNLETICRNFPRYAYFYIVDLNLVDKCDKQRLVIRVEDEKQNHTRQLCARDLDNITDANKSFQFENFRNISFEFVTTGAIKKTLPFMMQIFVVQCSPLKHVPKNTRLSYFEDTKYYVQVACDRGFVPWPGTPNDVKLHCGGSECYYSECTKDEYCDPTWVYSSEKEKEVDALRKMRCVEPAALTTAAPTTTTTSTTVTTTTVTSTSENSLSSTAMMRDGVKTTSKMTNKTSVEIGIQRTTRNPSLTTAPESEWPKEKTSEPQLVAVAGIIGGVAGFMVCLIMGIFIWMICRRSRICSCCRWWCCRCLDGFFTEKSDMSRTQSHLVGSVDDSTFAVRYRVPTMSTGLDTTSIHSNNRCSSVAASSTMGSLPFSSYRRNKKKPVHPLPHPSQLGYGNFDEMAPLCSENGHAWSPSVETYLEPNRRPSASSMGAMGGGRRHELAKFSTFHPKQRSDADYQEYDETRSSRNALDRFDGVNFDPRRSQALQSNHYYCRDDNSVNSSDAPMKDIDCESLYESVDDVISSVSSGGGSPRGARRFPAAVRNEYVQPQPPALPERPPGMDRSSRHAPVVDFAPDEDEDGYQPVNVKGRVDV